MAARSLRLSSSHRSLDVRIDELVRAQFAAFARVRKDEELVLQLVLGLRRTPTRVPPDARASLVQPVWKTLWRGDGPLPADECTELKAKLGSFAFSCVLRIGASAARPERRRKLVLGLLSALRTAQAPGQRLRVVLERPRSLDEVRLPHRWPLRLSVGELTGLLGLPLGDEELPGMPGLHPRLLAPTRLAQPGDRIVGEATAANAHGGRLGYSIKDTTRHTWVMGPTGVGKTALLTELARQAADDGHGLIYIEPKDGVADLLARIPEHRRDDVVLLDPSDMDAVVGLNPLDTAGTTPELVADSLVTLLQQVYANAWGPRIHDVLSAGILTLARRPGSTLVELPLLLSDDAFRRAVTKSALQDDPLGTGTFWSAFDQQSDGSRAQIIAPVMTRLRQWLTMPSLQATLGQTSPRITIREAIARGKLLLVPLQPGKLGAQVASLMSALVLHEVWIAMQERVHLPEAQRRPVSIFIDEVGSFLRTPTDLGEMLVLMRSLGGALTLSHQHLGQLGTDLHAALEANAASRIMFQLSPRDAAAIAKGDPQLVADDFTALPPFGIYARLIHDNRVAGWASGRTLPPSPAISDPEEIRRRSRARYARPVAEVAAEIRRGSRHLLRRVQQAATGGRSAGRDPGKRRTARCTARVVERRSPATTECSPGVIC